MVKPGQYNDNRCRQIRQQRDLRTVKLVRTSDKDVVEKTQKRYVKVTEEYMDVLVDVREAVCQDSIEQ